MSGDDSESERPFWEIVVPDLEYYSCSAILLFGLRGTTKAMTTSIFSGVVAPPTLRVRSVFTPAANPATDRGSMASPSGAPKWAQKTITLPPQRRGCHLITPMVSSIDSTSGCFFICWVYFFFLFGTDCEGN